MKLILLLLFTFTLSACDSYIFHPCDVVTSEACKDTPARKGDHP